MNDPQAVAVLLPKLIFGVMGVAIAGIVVYGFRLQREREAALRALAGFLDGAYSTRYFIPTFSGQCEGLPFSIELLPGSKHSPPQLSVIIRVQPRFKLGIWRESLGSSISKAVGLVKDLQTPDPQFNADFVLDGGPAAEAGAFLNSAENRDYLRRFFEAGFESLEFAQGRVRALKPRYGLEADLYPQVAAERVQVLAHLAKEASR